MVTKDDSTVIIILINLIPSKLRQVTSDSP